VLKPRVVCRFPKQRQTKVFRAICNEAFIICTQYTEARHADILISNIRKEKQRLYQAAFKYGKDHWKKEAIKEVVVLINAQPWWRRLWWAINPASMKIEKE